MYKKQLQTVSKRTKQLFLSSQLTLHGYDFHIEYWFKIWSKTYGLWSVF